MFRLLARQAKKNPGLIPQFFFISLGLGGASLYLVRLAVSPYVVWNKKNNAEPWSKLDPSYQYKFVAVTTDYKNLKKDRPDF
ncbi:NADH dehydrogenase [ubiquinone] 1 alpha subcomplex subunit 4-like 2 [Acipenser oxyrinchus oxyrinchus]|uniref:NADH dehydrogenase [ubiquinone] 1 alpha subcomplex subunit 4-like 2 n=1 Tax=Acipenser oxyrinchus oxyrinchus TaxID=40147 RepID=A0AAD8CGL8_ACIOX|nr:NADH dehydrogenase [ubiquinone] 1 alpha subcomplex subunit 4-like 2 [Acipenser oxyrinchus oxyrinchus]KAK1151304.1 NADH dehydrogenase [ubiquinone] 1 alpha subcomplex subunit 4-like 2 [Acipenser oxyrinchus oxyrinchus]